MKEKIDIMNADEFYKVNVAKQREILSHTIDEVKHTGDPIIRLPFDTYPVIEKEMEEAGWVYDCYTDQNDGKKYACFYPKQYEYTDEE